MFAALLFESTMAASAVSFQKHVGMDTQSLPISLDVCQDKFESTDCCDRTQSLRLRQFFVASSFRSSVKSGSKTAAYSGLGQHWDTKRSRFCQALLNCKAHARA